MPVGVLNCRLEIAIKVLMPLLATWGLSAEIKEALVNVIGYQK
jgi:hypothetical protein